MILKEVVVPEGYLQAIRRFAVLFTVLTSLLVRVLPSLIPVSAVVDLALVVQAVQAADIIDCIFAISIPLAYMLHTELHKGCGNLLVATRPFTVVPFARLKLAVNLEAFSAHHALGFVNDTIDLQILEYLSQATFFSIRKRT